MNRCAVRTDDRGGYRLTERPDGEEGQEYTLTFTDDDWITTYQWGVDCRLKAKIV